MVSVVVLLLVVPRVAIGGEDDEDQTSDATETAQKHFDRAANLYVQEEYGKAIVEFRKAYRVKPHPVFLYNLARTYSQLGQCDQVFDQADRIDEPERLSDEVQAKLGALTSACEVSSARRRVAAGVTVAVSGASDSRRASSEATDGSPSTSSGGPEKQPSPSSPPGTSRRLALGLSGAIAAGFVGGRLYDSENRRFLGATPTLEEPKLGLPSGIATFEALYSFEFPLAVGVEFRADFVNPSFLGSLVAEWRFRPSGPFAWSVGAGFGRTLGARKVVSPVRRQSGGPIFLSRSGPFHGTMFLGASWRLGSRFALTSSADLRFGFPEFSTLLDVGAGIAFYL